MRKCCHLVGYYGHMKPLASWLKQSCVIVNWSLKNKLHWTFDQNTKLFIDENASETIVCEMAAILPMGNEFKSEDVQKRTMIIWYNIIYNVYVKHNGSIIPVDTYFIALVRPC